MKKIILSVLLLGMFCLICGCFGSKVKSVSIPDGYQGTYVVKIWEGDNSVLPKEITGLVLKRTGSSYKIILSNIDEKAKTAEEIEDLKYTYVNGEFLIKFGETMKLKPEEGGLRGTLNFNGKPEELYLKKIK